MGIDEIIQSAVTPIVPRCAPKQYSGKDLEYCVYHYTELPDDFGDDEPQAIRYTVQLHWFFPWRPGISADAGIVGKKQKLRRALADAGFTWPTVTPAGDEEWEHYVFECEYADGEA